MEETTDRKENKTNWWRKIKPTMEVNNINSTISEL